MDKSKLKVLEMSTPRQMFGVVLEFPEFSCYCPVTKHPDAAIVTITYEPQVGIDTVLVAEKQSVVRYLESFRECFLFNESVADRILADFVEIIQPRTCEVVAEFTPRFGILSTITASFDRSEGIRERLML